MTTKSTITRFYRNAKNPRVTDEEKPEIGLLCRVDFEDGSRVLTMKEYWLMQTPEQIAQKEYTTVPVPEVETCMHVWVWSNGRDVDKLLWAVRCLLKRHPLRPLKWKKVEMR